jgi:ubiquinone biosynthesis protein
MSDQMPQLISELPEIPMLLINALKEIESGSFKRENSKKQTEAIVSQLKENATKQRSAIFALVFIISAGLLATQSAWVLTIASSTFGIIFWLKSR